MWAPVRSEVITGEGHGGLRFALLAPNGDDERIRQEGEYTVVFRYGADGALHTEEVPRPEYDGWELGDAVVVVVERLGGVVEVRRAGVRGD